MFRELLTLQGFGLTVTLHLICWAGLDLCIALLDLIGNEEMPDLNMPGALSHALVTILLQLHGTLIVLEYSGCGLVALGFQEVLDP